MKNLIVLLCFVLVSGFAMAQGAQKAYVKTVDPQASEIIKFEVNHPVGVQEWDEETLRILVDVTINNANDQILESLMEAGRYRVSTEKVDGKFVIGIPGLKKEVKVRGEILDEEVAIVIFVPRYIKVETTQEGTSTTVEVRKEIDQALVAAGMNAKGDNTLPGFEISFDLKATEQGAGIISDSEDAPAHEKNAQLIKELNSEIAAKNSELMDLVNQLAELQQKLEAAYGDN